MELRWLRVERTVVAPGSWVHDPQYVRETVDTLQYREGPGHGWIDVPVVVEK